MTKNKTAVFILIVLIACNMRAPITGVGSLVNIIGRELGLSSTVAGFLTTIPLLSFAAVSPIVIYTARKFGAGNMFFVSLLMLNIGIIIRSFCGNGGLFAGTVIIGAGIGIFNVLLPAVIKRYFPDKIESMSSMYTAVMQIVSTGSTALSVPMAIHAGWNWTLAIWFVPAIITLIFCIVNRRITISSVNENKKETRVYRASMTWCITSYMGVQSMVFYSFIAWLSPIMQDRGYHPTEAGLILSVFVVTGIFGSCAVPAVMKRNKSQVSTGQQIGILFIIGMIGMLILDSLIFLIPAIAVCGFCAGMCISFVMALIGLHTADSEDASRLSGISQSVGYMIAAAGPVALGKVYDMTGGWTVPMMILMTAVIFLFFMGRVIGRDEII